MTQGVSPLLPLRLGGGIGSIRDLGCVPHVVSFDSLRELGLRLEEFFLVHVLPHLLTHRRLAKPPAGLHDGLWLAEVRRGPYDGAPWRPGRRF